MSIAATVVFQLTVFTVERAIDYLTFRKITFLGTSLYARCLFNYE